MTVFDLSHRYKHETREGGPSSVVWKGGNKTWGRPSPPPLFDRPGNGGEFPGLTNQIRCPVSSVYDSQGAAQADTFAEPINRPWKKILPNNTDPDTLIEIIPQRVAMGKNRTTERGGGENNPLAQNKKQICLRNMHGLSIGATEISCTYG